MTIQCMLKNGRKKEYKVKSDASLEVTEGRYSLLLTNIPQDKNYTLKINDEHYDILDDTTYSIVINLINNIGYFKYEILDNKEKVIFKFQLFNKTYKLAKKEFYKMINFVANNNIWNNKQFVYYDRKKLPHKIIDPLFIFNWISNHFNIIEKLILKIDQKNNKNKITKYRKNFSNSNRYNKRKTMNHLRNNTELLMEDLANKGIIKVGDKTFNPQAVIKEKSISNVKTNEHLQILELLLKIYDFLNNTNKYFSHSRYENIRAKCKDKVKFHQWIKRLHYLKNNTFLKNISMLDIKHITRHPISQLQMSDSNYGEIYKLYKDFINDYYQLITENNNNFYQHIKNIDKVYESFCCYLLADILELEFIQNNFLVSGKAFENSDIALYYQSKPATMNEWALSDRPDIILKHKNGNIIILDSKFKIKNGNVKGEDIQKLQAYLNNYFQTIGGILYPGVDLSSTLDSINNIYQIHHIPIYPWSNDKYIKLKNRIKNEIYNSLT
ncbi:hypothetical protein JCM16358_25280 [Halanaerocella petrolearia]